jgi:hypothetical protein
MSGQREVTGGGGLMTFREETAKTHFAGFFVNPFCFRMAKNWLRFSKCSSSVLLAIKMVIKVCEDERQVAEKTIHQGALKSLCSVG